MDIDLIFKIVMLIVIIGISIKIIRAVAGLAFKIAVVLFIILFIYKMLM